MNGLTAQARLQESLNRVRPREGKPRTKALTSIIDYGPGVHGWTSPSSLADFLEVGAPFIDFVKLFGPNAMMLDSAVLDRIVGVYRDYGVQSYVGGLLYEFAARFDHLDDVQPFLTQIACDGIEISENFVALSSTTLRDEISRFRDLDLLVIYEFGRKQPDTPLSLSELDERLSIAFEAGAHHATIEQSEIAVLESGGVGIAVLAKQSWIDKVFIELDPFSFPGAHAEAIDVFGVGVNLANVTPAHVLAIEGFRRGIGRAVGYPIFSVS